MLPCSAGDAIPRGSAHGPVGEHKLQLTEHQVPVLAPGMPVLYNPLGGQIQHPAQGVIIGEGRLALGDLPELAVQPLNDVRRVYDFTNLRRVFKKGAQDLPVFLPAPHAGGILFAPTLRKGSQILFRLLQGHCRIDFFSYPLSTPCCLCS